MFELATFGGVYHASVCCANYLCLEKLSRFFVLQWLVPEGADVDLGHFWCWQNFPKRPHQSSIHPHQLLRGHTVGFVEEYTNFAVVSPGRKRSITLEKQQRSLT